MFFWLEPNYDLLNQKLQHPGQEFTTFAGAATWDGYNVKTVTYAHNAYSWVPYNLWQKSDYNRRLGKELFSWTLLIGWSL